MKLDLISTYAGEVVITKDSSDHEMIDNMMMPCHSSRPVHTSDIL